MLMDIKNNKTLQTITCQNILIITKNGRHSTFVTHCPEIFDRVVMKKSPAGKFAGLRNRKTAAEAKGGTRNLG